ncbi:UDP-N-acetylglucosamine 1-carboxyvinyltransferase [Candidatus Neomarinimicrobiota bacterium]
MDKFIIEGQRFLSGEVTVSGAKNAVLPIMAASLLWPGRYILHNTPDLRDTRTMARLLEMVGASVTLGDSRMEIDTSNCNNPEAPYELVKTMRASFYVLGPLLARFGRCRVSLPGGCNWGPRPVDLHIQAMKKLGATIALEGGYLNAEGKLKGAHIHFDVSSVGATGNALMAAVLAEGETILTNAAQEPEITALATFLHNMGAHIEGIGTTTLQISGQKDLKATEATIIPDRIEAGTFLIAGAMMGDEVTVKGAHVEHLAPVMEKLQSAGVELTVNGDTVQVSRPSTIKPADVVTAPYPGYPTDLQAQWIAFMTQAEGTCVVKDDIYHDRFAHVPELSRFGARIRLDENIATVKGPSTLIGAPVMSTDIRASASLVLAALAAKGTSEISRVYHLDRGYESMEKKFAQLGADIQRVK